MKIKPEVAARLTEMAERIATGYKLPDTVRGVIEQALYRAAGYKLPDAAGYKLPDAAMERCLAWCVHCGKAYGYRDCLICDCRGKAD